MRPSPPASSRPRRCLGTLLAAAFGLLGGCATHGPREAPHPPAEVRARVARLLPPGVDDRQGWATDIQVAFTALRIEPTTPNLCAALAVAGQESSFHADPVVPGLAKIARAEIDRRARRYHLPPFLVDAALRLRSPDGRSYGERLDGVRTEGELSRIYEDLVGAVPLGRRLFGDDNPVRTGGPMQVSVDFAEQFVRDHAYPYPVAGSIRREVFTRRGGVYFGIAHLLAYPAGYDRMIYRFADYNAGFYASRNAAFQQAVSTATGLPLTLDGDLVAYGSGEAGATERAVRTLGPRLDLSDGRIRRALEKGESADFADTKLYRRVYALAEKAAGRPLPRAMLPRIRLESPKITRKLTTAWFAQRVDQRYRTCLARQR
jgi:hypothetical protein